MAVVVQQTLPFPPSVLPTDNIDRWHDLILLLRPSLESVETKSGIRILADRSRLRDGDRAIVAAPRHGGLSSELLNNQVISAIILGLDEKQDVDSTNLRSCFMHAGLPEQSSIVIVQISEQEKLTQADERTALVQCKGALSFHHVLSILDTATESSRATSESLQELIGIYQKHVESISSTFTAKKVDGKPAIDHQDAVRELKSCKDAITHDLTQLFKSHPSPSESTTWAVHFADRNGLSRLEVYVVAEAIGKFFEQQKLPFQLSHSSITDSSSLDYGYAISLCPVPMNYLKPQQKAAPHVSSSSKQQSASTLSTKSRQIVFDDTDVRKRIISGCEAVMKAEPTITEYDTIVGDGDCGYTLRDGAKQVLQFIDDKDLARLPDVVDDLVRDLEINMGGTSGALYCIFLTALASSLATESSVPAALQTALDELLKYTRARLGDRTMMDALIPFVKTLNDSKKPNQALSDARKGVEGTKKMEAKLGRSTYLDESATQGVPDPGAYGLLILLEGMVQVNG